MTDHKPLAYAQQFRIADSTDILYHKRAWVPDWLWRRVASPDIPTLVRVRMRELRERQHKELEQQVFYGKGIAELRGDDANGKQ